jgi:ATP-dependent helicase/nuclease subunit A
MLVRNALSSPILERARKSKNIWREVSVMAPIERIVAEGIIDLVFEEDDGLVIVDYKTDNLYSDKEITLATDKYQLQILLYAYAINKATGKVVKEAGLLFLRANSFIGIENPKQFHEQAESAIAKYINNN